MTRTMTSTLGAEEQAAAGAALQATLVDLIDLSLVGKQAHWNLVTQDLLISITAELEKHHWMFQAELA